MNKQLVKKIVEVFNNNYKYDSIHILVETKDNSYYSYYGLYYDDNHVEFDDDYDDKISLSYEDIVGIKIGNR